MKKYLLILLLGLASCKSNEIQNPKVVVKPAYSLSEQQLEYDKLQSENEKLRLEVEELNKEVKNAESFHTEK